MLRLEQKNTYATLKSTCATNCDNQKLTAKFVRPYNYVELLDQIQYLLAE